MLATLIDMIHQDNDLGALGVRDEIHRTTHTLDDLLRDHVVGKVTCGRDFESLDTEMPLAEVDIDKDSHSE